jgi:hypothetical protein
LLISKWLGFQKKRRGTRKRALNVLENYPAQRDLVFVCRFCRGDPPPECPKMGLKRGSGVFPEVVQKTHAKQILRANVI